MMKYTKVYIKLKMIVEMENYKFEVKREHT